jgi:NAD(P) transhydrogenase subunit alpha
MSVDAMEAKVESLKLQSTTSAASLASKYQTEDVNDIHITVKGMSGAGQKVDAARDFAETKSHADMVKWMSGMVKEEKAAAVKADKEARLAALQASKGDGGGQAGTIIMAIIGLGFCAVMGFYPFPAYFIGNMMIFVLASVLGYCLVANVKASLHTPLMSMSNAISGIVIIGGMYQIQGDYLWGGDGLAKVLANQGLANTADAAEGGVTVTMILGAVAVAISAINIAGGFAVTFRMLDMFQAAPVDPRP